MSSQLGMSKSDVLFFLLIFAVLMLGGAVVSSFPLWLATIVVFGVAAVVSTGEG